MRKHLASLPFHTFLFLIIISSSSNGQNRIELKDGWFFAPVSKIKDNGNSLSKPSLSLKGWLPAQVPGTVLTSMLENRLVPDPFYGMNNQLIPDIYSTGREYYTYWFVKDFVEKYPTESQQVWLQLRGVNSSCEVYLNGRKLNDTTHQGMFLRQEYNVTAYLQKDGNNRLAVIVYPPDPVGNPNGGQGGDGMIAKNNTIQYVAGWDWIQPIRDRNTGIWDKVFIERTGSVNIINPHVVTVVPGIRKPEGAQQPAKIKLSAELENASGRQVTGVLRYVLNGTTVSEKVSLPPNSLSLVSLPDFILNNPRLWWPNGYGMQNLYKINLQFIQEGKTVGDEEVINFGVREITRQWNAHTLSSQFLINGQKIFIRGGNWIISDAMLRFSQSRYDAEIRFHRDMNLNLIRVWGGALLERPEFYDACDKYGLLVFQDFWMSGDCNGRWNDRMKAESKEVRRLYPDDHGLFIRSVADGIKMIRNHPSLAIWCGGNEIKPPDDILKAMKDSLFPQLDGTRYFFEFSNSDSMSTLASRGNGDGPYSIQPVDTFWKSRTFPFNSEVGSVGIGDYESLERFIPKENLDSFPEFIPAVSATRGGRGKEKTDSVWNYHKYIGYEKYIGLYGPVKDTRDFANRAQLINYDQYRALMEGFSSHMWDWYTGTIIWKTQNPWTAMRGQMYDYYLDPNACLYGLRAASKPVHAMYNPVEGTVMVANNGFNAIENETIRVLAWDMNGRRNILYEHSIRLGPSEVITAVSLKEKIRQLSLEKGMFLSLQLRSSSKQLIDENIYWLPDAQGMYSGLNTITKAALILQCRKESPGRIEVILNNQKGKTVAFFNRVSLLDGHTKKRVLPAFYSDNYITIMPGQEKKLIIEYEPGLSSQITLVALSGWNVDKQEYTVK